MVDRAQRNPWRKLVGGLLLNICVGVIFAFGTLSPGFQRLTGATADQAAVIGLAGDVGLWLNVIPGLLREHLGDVICFSVGAVLLIGGTIATCALLEMGHTPYLSVAVTWGCMGHGFCWLYCTNLFTNVKSWRHEARGYVVGSMQAFFGMSGTIMVSIYNCGVFTGTRLVEFIVFEVVLTLLLVCLARFLCVIDVKHLGVINPLALRRFRAVASYVVCLLAFVVITSLADQTSWNAYAIVASLICFGPVLLTVFPEDKTSASPALEEVVQTLDEPLLEASSSSPKTPTAALTASNPSSPATQPTGSTVSFADEGTDAKSTVSRALLEEAAAAAETTVQTLPPPPPPVEEEKEPLAAIAKEHWVEFWTLFIAFGAITGGAIATSNSMVAVVQSTRSCQYEHLATNCLTLLTASDAFARMIGGVLINMDYCDGNVVLAVGALLIGASHTIFSAAHHVKNGPYNSTDGNLFLIAAVMAGLANGSAWTSCPWLVSARFGSVRYGENFGTMTFAAVVGVLIFVKAILPLNDDPSDDDYVKMKCHYDDDDEHMDACYGAYCYATFHRSIQGAGLVAFCIACDLERKRRGIRLPCFAFFPKKEVPAAVDEENGVLAK